MRGFSLAICLAAAAVWAPVLAIAGDVLYEQLPVDPDLLLHASSQEFPDQPSFTIFAADDFTVSDDAGWSVDALNSYFTTGNGSGIDADGMRWIIWDDDGGDGTPGTEMLNIVGGAYDVETGLADINLGDLGEDILLAPGDYWFTSQIIAPIGTFGQEFHAGSLDGAGSRNFHWSNPGGGFELPNEGWNDAFGLGISDVQNLAFQIGGTVVPEPTTLGLLGALSLIVLRRRR